LAFPRPRFLRNPFGLRSRSDARSGFFVFTAVGRRRTALPSFRPSCKSQVGGGTGPPVANWCRRFWACLPLFLGRERTRDPRGRGPGPFGGKGTFFAVLVHISFVAGQGPFFSFLWTIRGFESARTTFCPFLPRVPFFPYTGFKRANSKIGLVPDQGVGDLFYKGFARFRGEKNAIFLPLGLGGRVLGSRAFELLFAVLWTGGRDGGQAWEKFQARRAGEIFFPSPGLCAPLFSGLPGTLGADRCVEVTVAVEVSYTEVPWGLLESAFFWPFVTCCHPGPFD